MKTPIILMSMVFTMALVARAQVVPHSQVPTAIANDFNKKIPSITHLKWEMDGSLYRADLRKDWNIGQEVWYTADGDLVKCKEDLPVVELPKAISRAIKAELNNHSIEALEGITDAGKGIYKMELKALIETDWNVVIDSEGQMLSKIED